MTLTYFQFHCNVCVCLSPTYIDTCCEWWHPCPMDTFVVVNAWHGVYKNSVVSLTYITLHHNLHKAKLDAIDYYIIEIQS